ncbi:hypothetical protein B7R54_02715 [Subtercola boreus]|uniref:Oxygen sensor histidine kinase NreB n=1 Tax=Subtercola boreus TaxID=120213 RepID=A0A3E0VHB5_9MICO|nr:sensor histidine kinase [Subtercola boreus]RFA08257.1 hypothetical protein B7R54_02715 [Subtercola boreus]TQL54850.1 signal transduction histidine kinase [Subtercola boreus]
MTRFSWWHLAVGVTVLALALIVLAGAPESPGDAVGAWSCLAVLAIGYAAFGWRSLDVRTGRATATSRAALVFPLLAIACTAVGTAFDPSMATLQAITFPVIWFSVDPTRRAIGLNIVLAVGVALGFLVSTGTSPEAVGQAVGVEAISLVFSLALGIWFSFALHQGQENTRLLEALRSTQAELAIRNRDSGIVSERERLAGEIHDTIAQSLTGLVMVAERTRTALVDDQPAVRADLQLIEDIAREALVETRALVAASAPVDVDGGLLPALERVIERFSRETGVRIVCDTAGYLPEPNDIEVVLLRSAQEALANVRKHSGATGVAVRLATGAGSVCLTVSDNGSGIVADQPVGAGFGLAGMQQRLSLLGGTLAIGTAPSGGAELTVTLPSRRLAEPAGEPASAGRANGDHALPAAVRP